MKLAIMLVTLSLVAGMSLRTAAAQPAPSTPPPSTAVSAAVDRVLALPYMPAYQPQGNDSAFGEDDYPAAFPLTDTADGSCCAGPVPDQAPIADLAPPFPDFPASFDRIQLTSGDGTPLHAFVSIVPGAPGIVVAQGFNTNGKHSIVRYAAFLRANGYSVIAPDHRDMGREWVRGGSWDPSGERRGQTLGWKESEDFLAAVTELDRRGVEPIGMLGLSEGAQNTILTLAEDHEGLIDAVMTFSAPADQATQGKRNDAATAALLTTVVNNPDVCGYLAGVGARPEFSSSANHILRQDSAMDALDGIIGGADVDAVPGLHLYAADDTLVQPYHATMLASRTNGLDRHRTVLVQAGNHAYFYDRWWVQAAALEWFGTWLDPQGVTGAEPTVAQTPGGMPMADQLVDLSTTTRADGDAERRDIDACPAAVEPIGPTPALAVEIADDGSVHLDARRSFSGWDGHQLTSWTVDPGDGAVMTGSELTTARLVHIYDQPGTFTVMVTVTDDTGRTASTTRQVTAPGRVERLAGADRIRTAVAVSQATFTAADTVVLASAGGFADALTAAPLAVQMGSPVLLVGDDLEGSTGDAVLDELRRLRALSVRVVGGSAAVPDAVVDRLTAEGLQVVRTGGDDRFATAAAIADEVGDAAGTVVLVDGGGFADAVSASAYAARAGAPLLLADRARPDGSLPQTTEEALDALAPDRVIVVGGESVVTPAMATAAGMTTRLAGADRYGTSVAVADASGPAGLSPIRTWIATGTGFADALTAGAAAARAGDALLLVDGTQGGGAAATWLADNPVARLTVVGGAQAITPDAEQALSTAVLGPTTTPSPTAR